MKHGKCGFVKLKPQLKKEKHPVYSFLYITQNKWLTWWYAVNKIEECCTIVYLPTKLCRLLIYGGY